MKKIFYLIIPILLFSCQEENSKEQKKKHTYPKKETVKKKLLNEAELIYDHGGTYLERYPTGETKVSGQKNAVGNKEGYWVAYNIDGSKQSECSYSNGKRHGINMVYWPNGNVSYQIEWNYDKKTGKSKYYAKSGTLIKTVDHDK